MNQHAVRQKTAEDGKRPQETAKKTGILKFTENCALKS